MKKFIFYIDAMTRGGGANRVMANLANAFSNDGYDIVLITDVGPKSNILEYDINNLVKRYCLDEIIEENSPSNYKRIKTIRDIIKDENPDTILSFMGPPNIRMTLATVGLKTRKVVSVRSDPKFEYGTGINKLLKSCVLSLADGFVFQTGDAAKYFSKRIQSKSKIIFNPVREDFFDITRSDEVKDIVSVGRLSEEKNHKLLIDAFARISNKFPNENLVIYGDGPLKESLEQLAGEYKLSDRIKFPGAVDNVAEKLSKAKIFVLSSTFEGMPNALMEAMALGVPAIATDCPCGGPRALITNEKEGKLVACGDVAVMTSAMEKLLTDSELKNEMSICEKTRAEAFRPETIYKEWKDFLLKANN